MSLFSRTSSTQTSYSVAKPCVRHDRYYLSSGDVVFRVENHLFRVHRYFFVRESVVFRDMLSMPSPAGVELEGASDANPISLPDVKSVDFARFLWVFYNPKYSIYEADLDVWISILNLAHFWQFDEVKELAIRELDKMNISPVTKAVLAQQHEVERGWAEAAYAALGARAEPLTCDEGQRLGLKVALQIAEVRERIRERRSSRPCTPMPGSALDPPPSFGAFPDPTAPPVSPMSTVYEPNDLEDVKAVFGMK